MIANIIFFFEMKMLVFGPNSKLYVAFLVKIK